MIALTKQCRTVELLFEVVIYWNLSRQHFKRRAAQKSSYQRKAIFHISWERDQLLRQKGVEEYETTIFGIHYERNLKGIRALTLKEKWECSHKMYTKNTERVELDFSTCSTWHAISSSVPLLFFLWNCSSYDVILKYTPLSESQVYRQLIYSPLVDLHLSSLTIITT